jgi:hypothetical protein
MCIPRRLLPMIAMLVVLAVSSAASARPVGSDGREAEAAPTQRCLADTSWKGCETLSGYGPLTFDFCKDGSAVMHDVDGCTNGTWQQLGQQVTLFFYEGRVVYVGTIDGDVISGGAANSSTQWQWTVGLQ